MQAMVLNTPGRPLRLEERPDPEPRPGQVRLRVEACAVCRTDLHIVDGELPVARLPMVPGHEIVGIVDRLGGGTSPLQLGQRVGVTWLAHTCGHCAPCCHGQENLCNDPLFTGHGVDGGFATHVIVEQQFCIPLSLAMDAVHTAPLLCAGAIGWRALRKAGLDATNIGLYGFGAAAHLMAQVARHQGRTVHAFTRPGDTASQSFALSLGATWAGGSDELPAQPLDAAIILAPVGALVPMALQAIRKGGRVICAGIHMSDIPSFPYRLLWGERQLMSVANLTRDDASEFLKLAGRIPVRSETTVYPLAGANEALADLRAGRLQGAAVLVPSCPSPSFAAKTVGVLS